MKKLIVLMIVATLTFAVGCSKEKKQHEKGHVEEMAQAYYCPMECEGDTTYTDKEAKCPVCKMDLVEKKKEGEHEQHEGHDDSIQPNTDEGESEGKQEEHQGH